MTKRAVMQVELRGYETVIAALRAPLLDATMRSALAKGGARLKDAVDQYPGPASPFHVRFRSDRHRRGFFARLRSGEIEVPYRRGVSPGSQNLIHKWTVAIARSRARVDNNVGYAEWVHGDRQAWFHAATGWRRLTDVVRSESGAVLEIVRLEIEGAIRAALNRGR
jgi:hypothetical protein